MINGCVIGTARTTGKLIWRIAYYGIKFHGFHPFLFPIAGLQYPVNKLPGLILHHVDQVVKIMGVHRNIPVSGKCALGDLLGHRRFANHKHILPHGCIPELL